MPCEESRRQPRSTRLFLLTPRFKFLPMTMKQGSAILIVKLERNIKMTTGGEGQGGGEESGELGG